MDHFHIAPGVKHIRIRYFGEDTDEPYDGGSFLGYPKRAEWEAEARLHGSDIPSREGGHHKRRRLSRGKTSPKPSLI